MNRWALVSGFFVAALLCGITFLCVSQATVVPLVAKGTGPDGVQVTAGGWLAFVASLLGTGGLTLAGVVTAIMNGFGWKLPSSSSGTFANEIIELTASFAALMRDQSNRASQRRFFFALVDAARLIVGCETSHEGGVVVIRYSGYADPVTSASKV